MTHIESDKVIVNKSAEELFQFLGSFENIGKLMPDQVSNFTTDGETCRFEIKGMATLGLAYKAKVPNSEIIMTKDGKAPFDFELMAKFDEIADKTSELKLVLNAELNPIMKMMAEKPLKNFLNMLVNKYKDISGTVA